MERARLGDDELAGRAARGDERAFEELYRRYERPLLRYCRSITGDDEDASDALQSAMLGAVRALPRRTRDSGVRAWLYAIARNESISVLRRRRPVTSEEAIDVSGVAAPSADVVAADRERAAQVVIDLGQLSERQRDAIILRELGDVSFEEIAVLHGSTPHAVRQSVTEARTALKEIAAGREAACATIRPALIDRRRRSRAVRAHLNSCRSCQAIAGAQPRHAFAPFAAVAYFFKRIAAVFGMGEAGQGLASTIVSSGVGKPAAAAGVALVAALATTGATQVHHATHHAKPVEQHATAPKKHHAKAAPKRTVAAVPKSKPAVKPKSAPVAKVTLAKAPAKTTVSHTVAAVVRKPTKKVTKVPAKEDPVDNGNGSRHQPANDPPPVREDFADDPPPQQQGGDDGQRHGGGNHMAAARSGDCPQGGDAADDDQAIGS